MATKNTKLKDFQITKEAAKNLKGGYASDGIGGGTGSNGFIIWDDIDPRDNALMISMPSISASFMKFKKK
ncbi:MAG: hypothetical protein ACI9XO_000700 [Paraglaciecola sp.]|jgi:hypothetical protein